MRHRRPAGRGAPRLTPGVQAIIERIKNDLPQGRPVALVINKIDRVKAEQLLPLAEELNGAHSFAATFMISAERATASTASATGWPTTCPKARGSTPEDQLPTSPCGCSPPKPPAKKLTLRCTRNCPPTHVETEKWEDREDGSVRIDQIIYVAREGHKGIVLGAKGATLKPRSARRPPDIAEFLGRPCHLFLTVKLRENWMDEAERYGEMGLDFRDGDAK